MPNYSPEKIDKCLKLMEKVLELHKKQDDNYKKMIHSLKRIRRAMNKELNFDDEVKVEMEKVLDITKSFDTYKYDLLKRNPAILKRRARENIMKRYNFEGYGEIFPRWDDFIFYMKKSHKRDREKLIKEGSIKA